MTRDASSSEQALQAKKADGGFAIALSGGGHRATLATLGALMAIVDRGLSGKVVQIASVSGGSITNAFVAQRCNFEKLGPFELDDVAAELAGIVVRKGVLTRSAFVLMLLAAVFAGMSGGYAFYTLILPWTMLSIFSGVSTAFVVLLGRGMVVEWLLDRRYFRRRSDKGNNRARSQAPLKSLSGTEVDHVFCMTDYVLGLPVYASSQLGGIIYRRLSSTKDLRNGFDFQTFDAGQASLAGLVRASAGFPGIPPRRMKFPPDQQNELVKTAPRFGYLADGGLWNNLGSQVLREDEIIFTHFAWGNGAIRPYGKAPAGFPLLCINGSAPLQPTQSWVFNVPGLALLKSLLQTASILNANTVLPRIDAMRRAFRSRIIRGDRPDFLDPADLSADLRPTREGMELHLEGTWAVDLIEETDPSVKKWQNDVARRVQLALEHMEQETEVDWLRHILAAGAVPRGSYPVCGLANFDDYEALRLHPTWIELVEAFGIGEVGAPTTLGPIDPNLARDLIARSYLNTYFISLFLAPLRANELDSLSALSSRINKVVGNANT